MSELFGVDFSRVQVHPDSAEATGSVRAVARGEEIHFREGAYQPGTPEGDRVIAHELAHLVQQRRGRGGPEAPRRELEREADLAASLVARGQPARVRLRAAAGAYAYSDAEDHDVDAGELEADAEAHPRAAEEEERESQRETDRRSESDHREPRPDREVDEAHARDGQHTGGATRQGETQPALPQEVTDETAETGPGALPEVQIEGGDRSADEVHADRDGGRAADGEADGAAESSGGDLRGEFASLGGEPVAAEGSVPGGTPGGAGGGAAPKPLKEAPKVASAPPEAAFGQLVGVRPDKVATALPDVRTAASADVEKTRAKAHANPPRQLSTGESAAPSARKIGAPAGADEDKGPARSAPRDDVDRPVKPELSREQAAKEAKQREAAQAQKSAGRAVQGAGQASTQHFSSIPSRAAEGDAGAMSDADAQQMAGSIDRMSADLGAIETDPGTPPTIAMKGEARSSADGDRAELESEAAAAETQAHADRRVPMGEDDIETTVPTEELTAQPIKGRVPEVSLPTVGGAASSEDVGIIAQEQHQVEIDAALGKASSDVAGERARHEQADLQARADSDRQIRELKTQADGEQDGARRIARTEVDRARGEWQGEVDKKGVEARAKADQKIADGMVEVETEEEKANTEAREHIDEGKKKADEEKQKGEREAEEAKKKGQEKSSGFWGWVKSKAKALVDGIKKAISAVIDIVRKAIKAVIEAAKRLAMAAIELARKAIVAVIEAIGKALIAITDVLLAAFPELKARFQKAIRGLVDKAVETVNKVAEGLKKAVQKALDLLGAALDKALGFLEKGLHAIVDVAGAVINAAIAAAEAIANMLGVWAKLIKDVAASPGSWISKLGAAVVDGIKNHLWTALKSAVIDWFQSKVFELLGLGGLVLQILLDGGITTSDITDMAIQALIIAIPVILVTILIEKLVSMIVPAAGAVMAIIEGLIAAWGTISRIIAAFAAFVGFLLAVKGGGAGPLFAGLLAAAAVVVLDFIANWLLRKLAGPARKVGKRLEKMAEKFKARGKGKKPGAKDGPDGKAPRKDRDDEDGPDARPSARKDGDSPGQPRKPRDDRDPARPRQRADRDGPGRNRDRDKDRDPHRRKDKDRDKNDRGRNDQAAARRAANAAARRGWQAARAASSRELLSSAEMQRILARAARSTPKARIDLDVKQVGDGWSVKADARVGKAHATASAGHGWIARGQGGQRFYAASDMRAFNKTLMDEALAELRRDDDEKANDLKDSYHDKVAEGRRVEKKQQSALDRRIRGVKFHLEMEPFSGAEKDKKVRIKVRVTPNEGKAEGEAPISLRPFHERFGTIAARKPTKVDRAGGTNVHLEPADADPPEMVGNDKLPGYVINMSAIPSEAGSGMASRYFAGAWDGSPNGALAKFRTAVVAGINKFYSIDPKETSEALQAIRRAVASVSHIPDTLMAIFGFIWEPHWEEKGKGPVSLERVRSEWQKTEADQRDEERRLAEQSVTNPKTLPYGDFRNEVIESSYSKQAVKLVSAHTQPVHILTQDGDGQVETASGKGLLAEYDRFLAEVEPHPLLTIGGYRFSGFDWSGTSVTRRSRQLTVLGNEIDRAMRQAIGKVFPKMLYPTEPNMLIKAHDEEHKDGIYDRGIERGLFGHGGSEGRTAGQNIEMANQGPGRHPDPVAHAPSTSPTSGPAPNNPNRGLTLDEENIPDAESGEYYKRETKAKKIDPKKAHAFVLIEEQAQNMISPRRLTHEFNEAVQGDADLPLDKLRKRIFNRPAELGQRLTDNPALEVDVDAETEAARREVDRLKRTARIRDNERAKELLDKALELVREMIETMTSDEMRQVWSRLRRVLDSAEAHRRQVAAKQSAEGSE